MIETFVVAGAVAVAIGGVRWLRVAQREHYLAPSVTRFALRWWMSTPANRLLLGIAVIGAVGVWWEPLLGWLGLLVAVGPLGLTIRGRSSPLRWTWRLRRVAVSAGVLVLVSVIGSLLMEHPGVLSVTVVLLPAVIDLVLMVLAPIERAIGERWVRLASAKLASSGAKVVAITGSYGKTTTKGYVAHLLAGTHSAVSTPASFNNRMGLARAINEHLTAGASVFVAEMGTYGKGEIADLCEFVPPDVAAITSIGPVHLERFGSEAAIVEAKGEILHRAEVAILNIDHPLLSELANQHQIDREVMRVSAFDPGADVSVIEGVVRAGGEEIGRSGPGVFAANLAAAVAVALALD
ncbi:MAG: Mur ligase family protein, partial [Acidimicrobiia bacterium]